MRTSMSHNWRAVARRTAGLCMWICMFGVGGAATAQDKNAIETIQARQVGTNTVVTVSMKEPLEQEPIGFSITNPARVVLDLAAAINGTGSNLQDLQVGEVRSVNVVQADDRSRLVFNLKKPLNFTTETRGRDVVVTLGESPEAPVAASQIIRSTPAPTASAGTIRDIDFRRGANGEGRVIVNLSGSQNGVTVQQQGQRIVVDFRKGDLPAELQRRLDVTDFGTPIQTITTSVVKGQPRMVIEPKGHWEHSAYQTDAQLVVEVKPIRPDQAEAVARKGKSYKGEKLSLNFQNVEVRAVLRVIADFTGLNIVTSDSVTGNLTLRLKDVPWDQALDIVLQSKGLDMRANGNVLWIAPKDELLAKEKLELEQKSHITELEPLYTQSFRLNYHKAEALKGILDSAEGERSILTKRGSAIIDTRSNQLFVTETAAKLEEIEALIRKIDIPTRQVLIEARIVEADDKFSRNLGSRLAFGARTDGGGPNVGIGGGLGAVGPSFGAVGGSNVVLPASGINGYPAGSVALTLFNSAATRFLNLELSALESDGNGKVLSSPRVITGDQMKALIEQGTELPYQKTNAEGVPSIEFRKANLKLEVIPQITPDNNVILEVDINKDSVGQLTTAGFAIDTKHVQTQVLIENGGTVAIGGIYIQQDRQTDTKVPMLGDIPGLGWLFKTRASTNDRTELIIFLTPKIIDDSVQLR
jgi:type IV pilus assembly protein PilQ